MCIDLAVDSKEAAGAPGIEITDEMLHAGADVLSPKTCCRLVDSVLSPMEVAAAVFLAMSQAES